MICVKCGKSLSYDEVGMTKKLFGKNINKFFCLDCLSEDLNIPKEILIKKMEAYRKMGCLLFLQDNN